MTDKLRFRVRGLRPYLREDGKATWGEHGWRISADFDVRLSEVLERVIGIALRSAESRGKRLLLASDLERVELALRVADVLSRRDGGNPRSSDAGAGGIPGSLSKTRSNPRTAGDESAIPEDSR